MENVSVTFPGLAITRADMVFSHGVDPSVCRLIAIPIDYTATPGSLTFYVDGAPSVVLRDCLIKKHDHLPSKEYRGQRMHFSCYDRRWRWKFRYISGKHKNKTYLELVGLLLDALGEGQRTINLPNPSLTVPEVEWNAVRADLELASLLESVGCMISIRLDNSVSIAPYDRNPSPSPKPSEMLETKRFTLPLLSGGDQVVRGYRACAGETVFQSKLLLEAVGEEISGDVRPIDKLSYKPDGGWGAEAPGFLSGVTDDEDYELAINSVYRWYRVKAQADGSISLPVAYNGRGQRYTISTINDLLPLLPYRLVYEKDMGGVRDDFLPPYIEGRFFNNDLTGMWQRDGEFSRWDDSFLLDHNRGLVMFAQPVCQVADTGYPDPAELYLECAYHARADAESANWRYCAESGQVDDPSLVRQLSYTYVYHQVVQHYNEEHPTTVTQNGSVIDEQLRAVIDAASTTEPGGVQIIQHYAGLLPIDVGGPVHQVHWQVGGQHAKTVVYYNTDTDIYDTPHRLRRERQEILRRVM